MNRPAVNLGAGGFVSYMEDGGATVIVEEGMQEAPEYTDEELYRHMAVTVSSLPVVESILLVGFLPSVSIVDVLPL